MLLAFCVGGSCLEAGSLTVFVLCVAACVCLCVCGVLGVRGVWWRERERGVAELTEEVGCECEAVMTWMRGAGDRVPGRGRQPLRANAGQHVGDEWCGWCGWAWGWAIGQGGGRAGGRACVRELGRRRGVRDAQKARP